MQGAIISESSCYLLHNNFKVQLFPIVVFSSSTRELPEGYLLFKEKVDPKFSVPASWLTPCTAAETIVQCIACISGENVYISQNVQWCFAIKIKKLLIVSFTRSQNPF